MCFIDYIVIARSLLAAVRGCNKAVEILGFEPDQRARNKIRIIGFQIYK